MVQELKTPDTTNEMAVLWNARDLQKYCHFSRTRAYQVLGDPTSPTIHIGGRVYIMRKQFIELLEANVGNRDRPLFDDG